MTSGRIAACVSSEITSHCPYLPRLSSNTPILAIFSAEKPVPPGNTLRIPSGSKQIPFHRIPVVSAPQQLQRPDRQRSRRRLHIDVVLPGSHSRLQWAIRLSCQV